MRDYQTPGRDTVENFYLLNHRLQTLDFVKNQFKRFVSTPTSTRSMTWLEALTYLDTLVDDSDPDTELSQLQHLLQTAEAIRRDDHEDWFVLTGFIHDLGKILCFSGEPQWSVVGDTFPVGCRFSDKIVYPHFFADNPDSDNPAYQTPTGIYEPACGLRNVTMSWGHDEYLFQYIKDYLPEPAQYMIRFHSFYAWHQSGAYDDLCDDHDREMLPWVKKFNPYDLYSKADNTVNWDELRPYYLDLIEKYLPAKIAWAV